MTEQEEMYLGDISADELEILKALREEFTTSMKCYLSNVLSVFENLKYDELPKETRINVNFNLIFIKMVTELNEHLIEKAIPRDASFKQMLNIYKCLMRAANDLFDEEIEKSKKEIK
ncbi:MAG: hypothetical protein SPI61_00205 [Ezakiella sp.]|jgi:hypothetical protein|uniref:hypothetical protein n=1 Tax=Ezakiella sp. TaxID=1935205 RepID=UPI002A90F109|nr:hypothetical protein [Ezakiella sp.]MDY6079152.1 hypothetical protein [Ezakiella sp.]